MVQWFEISTAPLWAQLDDWRWLSRLPSFKPKVNLSGRRGTYILELQPRKETSQADSVSLRAHWRLLICLILRWSTRNTLRTETKAAAVWQQIPYQSLASRPSCFYAGAKTSAEPRYVATTSMLLCKSSAIAKQTLALPRCVFTKDVFRGCLI